MKGLVRIVVLALGLGGSVSVTAADYRQPKGLSTNIYIAEWSRLRHMADSGDLNSQFQLANFYYDPPEGSTLPHSFGKAAKYYRLAALQNHAASQHNMGVLYLKGEGVDRDWAEAYAWFSLSAEQGYQAAVEAVNTLKTRLTGADLSRAQARMTEIRMDIR